MARWARGEGCSPPVRAACTAAAYCCVSTPLLEAMVPTRRGSASHALRSARAKALKVASTMWWEFLPASCS